MTPVYQMPEPGARMRQALVSDITDAVAAARCLVHLAGAETDEFIVRELLLTVIQQLDRAASTLRRLHVDS